MRKIPVKIGISGLTFVLFFSAAKAYAMCPVCTLAVGGALVLAEKYGVDNTISGLWFGALAMSVSLWTIDWFKKREWSSKINDFLVVVFYYASIIIPLYLKKAIGLPTKRLWGIDKVILGMILGTIAFYLTYRLYLKLKERNNGKAWFPFQKVVMSLIPLLILSIIFYYLTKK